MNLAIKGQFKAHEFSYRQHDTQSTHIKSPCFWDLETDMQKFEGFLPSRLLARQGVAMGLSPPHNVQSEAQTTS